MGIVVITIPGEIKREFVNTIHQKTGGNVDLVIIQNPKRRSLWARLRRLRKNVSGRLFMELWYAFVLRINARYRDALEYFRGYDVTTTHSSYLPRVLEVDSVNNEDVYAELKKLSPDLLVVWGSTLLQPRILSTAKQAVNLHLGFCPFYRGALANQHAVLREDFSRLGATIHFINHRADAGDILRIVAPPLAGAPKEFFRELNTKAWHDYVDIVTRLWNKEELPRKSQDVSISKVMLLREWTPSVRYKVAKRVLQWEEKKTSKE